MLNALGPDIGRPLSLCGTTYTIPLYRCIGTFHVAVGIVAVSPESRIGPRDRLGEPLAGVSSTVATNEHIHFNGTCARKALCASNSGSKPRRNLFSLELGNLQSDSGYAKMASLKRWRVQHYRLLYLLLDLVTDTLFGAYSFRCPDIHNTYIPMPPTALLTG